MVDSALSAACCEVAGKDDRLPEEVVEWVHQFQRVRICLAHEIGHEPTREGTATEMGTCVDDLKSLRALTQPSVSLEELAGPSNRTVTLRARRRATYTLQEIGEKLGVSREHVRQHEANALACLRENDDWSDWLLWCRGDRTCRGRVHGKATAGSEIDF